MSAVNAIVIRPVPGNRRDLSAGESRWGNRMTDTRARPRGVQPAASPSEGEVAAELARRIGAGDAGAETELVERYSQGLLFMLRHLSGKTELAEDLHQETFRVVLERLRRRGLEDPAGLLGYLRGTARNLLLGHRRTAERRRTETGADDFEHLVDPAPSQLAAVLRSEACQLVHRLIRELATDRDRQLLYRFYVAEDDKEEICADFGLSSSHFNRVLFRARRRFRTLLQGHGELRMLVPEG